MKRILLTGATGFVGSYVARLLVDKKYNVTAIKRKTSRLSLVSDISEKIDWIDCDLQDIDHLNEIMPGIEGIIHCAAKISLNGPKDKDKLFKINTEATKDLINLALEHKVKRFVYLSSIAALGNHTNNLNLNEQTEWNDNGENTSYGVSKQMGEREVWRGYAEGLETVILNPSLILGAGIWNRGSSNIFKQLHTNNLFYPLGSIGLVDVRDVANLSVLALESNISGERFIVSSENWSFKDLVNKLAELYKKPKPKYALSKPIQHIIITLDYLRSKISRHKRMITHESLDASNRLSSYENDKIINTFSYNFIEMDASLQETADIFLKSLKTGKKYGLLNLINFKQT